jgi:hypothetical protein
VRVFVANLVAGGVGITLTAARQVVFNDLDWVPANHWQAEDRAYRIGQTGAVNVTYLTAEGTVDEFVSHALRTKAALVDAVVDGTGAGEERLRTATCWPTFERLVATLSPGIATLVDAEGGEDPVDRLLREATQAAAARAARRGADAGPRAAAGAAPAPSPTRRSAPSRACSPGPVARRWRVANGAGGGHYLLDADAGDVTCTCRGFEYRGACRHARALTAALAAGGDVPPSSSRSPPNGGRSAGPPALPTGRAQNGSSSSSSHPGWSASVGGGASNGGGASSGRARLGGAGGRRGRRAGAAGAAAPRRASPGRGGQITPSQPGPPMTFGLLRHLKSGARGLRFDARSSHMRPPHTGHAGSSAVPAAGTGGASPPRPPRPGRRRRPRPASRRGGARSRRRSSCRGTCSRARAGCASTRGCPTWRRRTSGRPAPLPVLPCAVRSSAHITAPPRRHPTPGRNGGAPRARPRGQPRRRRRAAARPASAGRRSTAAVGSGTVVTPTCRGLIQPPFQSP